MKLCFLCILLLININLKAQTVDQIQMQDTVYIYFKEDGKYQIKNDKHLSQNMLNDSVAIYGYNLRGTGREFGGEFRFINKNYNSEKFLTSRPLNIDRRFLKRKKEQTVNIDYFKSHGYKESYFSAIENKKALFIIENKNGRYILLEVDIAFTYPYEH